MRPEAATLRLAVFPRSSLLTDVLLILGGASFVALAAQVSISLPFTPVPITGQTFAVVLVGASLGSLLAVASLGVYIFVGALGAPVYADQTHGWDVLKGPTGGYNVVIYLVGLPWLAAKIDTGLEDTLEAGLYPFVVGDLLKLYLAGALLPAAWALVRRFKG